MLSLRRFLSHATLLGHLTLPAAAAPATVPATALPPSGGLAIFGPIAPGSLVRLAARTNLIQFGTLNIYIDSPGGDVAETKGLMIALDAARARGVKVSCFAMGNVQSAAFWLFTHCDERHALAHSHLMFHHIRMPVATNLTAKDAEALYLHLSQEDREYVGDIAKLTRTPIAKLERWMDEAVLWTAPGLATEAPGIITSIDVSYPDLLPLLQALQAPMLAPAQSK